MASRKGGERETHSTRDTPCCHTYHTCRRHLHVPAQQGALSNSQRVRCSCVAVARIVCRRCANYRVLLCVLADLDVAHIDPTMCQHYTQEHLQVQL